MWPAGLFNASADTSCAALLHLGNKFEKVHRGPAWQQPTVPLTHLGLGHLLLLLDLVWPKIGKNNCAAKIGACRTLIGAFRLSPFGSSTKSNLGRLTAMQLATKNLWSEDISDFLEDVGWRWFFRQVALNTKSAE